MNCPNCGSELKENAKFCVECGTPIAAPAEQEEPVPVETPNSEPEPEPVTVETPEPVLSPAREEAPVAAPVVPTFTKEPESACDSRMLLTTAQYFFLTILFQIPIIGLVFLFVWGIGRPKNLSLKRFALAMLIMKLIGLVLSLIATILMLLAAVGVIPGIEIRWPFVG